MGIFEGALPAGWSQLNDEQKARAAAMAIGFRFTDEGLRGVDQVDAAVFILDGAESYALHRRIMALEPEESTLLPSLGQVHQFDFGSSDDRA